MSHKFSFKSGFTIAREAFAIMVHASPKNRTNSGGERVPNFSMIAQSHAAMLGYSFGDESRFSLEFAIPFDTTLAIDEEDTVTEDGSIKSNMSTTKGKSQMYGASIDIGGLGSGYNITYRYMKVTADNAFGRGQDIRINTHALGIDFRYRWNFY